MKEDFNRNWTFYNSNGRSRIVNLPYDAMLFEGIYGNTTVYVNGKTVCQNANGYLGFEVALNGYLKAGNRSNHTERYFMQNMSRES